MKQTIGVGSPRRKPESLRAQAYEALKRSILNRELKPGEAVTVSGLSDSLGIGRTPVIQAVDRLMQDGLVEVVPRKGVVVSPVSLDHLVEIIEVRLLNEVQAARWAAERISNQQLEAMRKNLDKMREATVTREISDLIALDSEFHSLISHATNNALLVELLGNLHDRSLRFWTLAMRVPNRNEEICDQHAAIVKAIANRDPEAAGRAMQAHINDFQSNIVGQIIRR